MPDAADEPPSLEPLALEESTRPPETTVRPDSYLGRTLDGRYTIERLLGQGGMGVVYAARHKLIDKRVAIKVLRGDMAKERENTHRFLQEARAASAVGSPHIVDVSDFGTLPDGSEYFVMELLEGQSLAQALENDWPLPIARVLSLGRQIARGLAAAHASGIVHRDLKPDNVMLVTRGGETDFVKVVDFGIAKVGAGTARITVQGTVFGTPHYMSPEQAAGSAVDHRTDIYALGVILYELSCGEVPFDGDNYISVLSQHAHKVPERPRARAGGRHVPVGLEQVILRCLAKSPGQRYASMGEVEAELDALAGGEEERAPRRRPPPGAPVSPRRLPWTLAAFAGAVVMVVSLGALLWQRAALSPPGAIGEGRAATSGAPARELKVTTGPHGASPSGAAPSAVAPPPEATQRVLVAVEPMDARVTRDGRDLGRPPVEIDVDPAAPITLVLAREGYKSQSIVIDGTQAWVRAKLAAIPRAAASAPALTPVPGRPVAVPARSASPDGWSPSVTSDLGDPWKK